MWSVLTATLAALASLVPDVADTPPIRPLPGNEPCAYPAPAKWAAIAGPVLYTAQIRPKGSVKAVDIRRVPAKDLGFEEAVRDCVSKWRFEPTVGTADLRPYEGRIRYRIAGTANDELAIRGLLQAFASGWNAENPNPDAILDALQGAEPARGAGLGPPSPLAGQFREERTAADWNMDLDSDLEQIRFLSPDLAIVRQPFQRRTSSGVSPQGDGQGLLEASATRKGESWVLLGWYPIAGPPSSRRWLAPGIEEPRKLKHVDPVYPDRALRARVSALVILRAEVDSWGHVEQVNILRGHPLFGLATTEALKQWEYEPTLVAGTPASVTRTVSVTFSPDGPRGRVSIEEHSQINRRNAARPTEVLESVAVQLPSPTRSVDELQAALDSDSADERASAAWESAGARPVVPALLDRLHGLSRGDPEEHVRLAAAWGYSHLEEASGRKRLATCLEFGPRFLHSTGQTYKGGPNTGVFLQITCDDAADLAVPGQKYTFGVVKATQARGDFQVLLERNRRALRAHLGADVAAGLKTLQAAIMAALE